MAGLYLICYSVGRFILEFFRGDLIRGSVGTLSSFSVYFYLCLYRRCDSGDRKKWKVPGRKGRRKAGRSIKVVTIQPAPFVKPHCVLIVANATVLLIDRRLAHTDVRLQKHASMFCASRTLYG